MATWNRIFNFFRHSAYRRELTAVLLLKLVFLMVLKVVFFSPADHPPITGEQLAQRMGVAQTQDAAAITTGRDVQVLPERNQQ